MVRLERFERPTAWFVARYSIQLSYRRLKLRQDYAHPARYRQVKNQSISEDLKLNKNGGEGGIRTLDRAINPILP